MCLDLRTCLTERVREGEREGGREGGREGEALGVSFSALTTHKKEATESRGHSYCVVLLEVL